MPAYPTVDSLPEGMGLQQWQAFIDRLTGVAEMQWLNGNVVRHDITALKQEDWPKLCVVKIADDYQRHAVGKSPPYKVVSDYGIKLYFFVAKDLKTPQVEAIYDTLENANEVMIRVLKSAYMACNEPYWKELFLEGGTPNRRTSYIQRDNERLYMATSLRLVRGLRPGQ